MHVYKPSPRYQVKLYIAYLLFFSLVIFPWTFLGFIPDLGLLYAVLYLLANALWLVPVLVLIPAYVRRISYTLDEREITVYKGLVTQVVQTVPLSKVTNLSLNRGPLDRILGLGSLQVHTAGFSGQNQGPEVALLGLEDYATVQQLLLEKIRTPRQAADEGIGTAGTADGSIGAAATPQAASVLAEILGELKAIHKTMED